MHLLAFPLAAVDGEISTVATKLLRFEESVFRIGKNVSDIRPISFKRRPPDSRTTPGSNRIDFINISNHAMAEMGHACGASFSRRKRIPRSASQSLVADSSGVLRTVCRSKVARLMTLSTSAVAVCRCSDSRNSLSSRVFLDGDDHLGDKTLHQRDLLFGEGPGLGTTVRIAPIADPSRNKGTAR